MNKCLLKYVTTHKEYFMNVIKVRVDDIEPEHVRCTIFCGMKHQTLANNGSLCFNKNEFCRFVTCLAIGALETEVIFTFKGHNLTVDNLIQFVNT